ncbi:MULTISPECIES: type I-C CRISPR-associated endonuclease Cas1c [Methylotuvimicrobium]|uniref:CRISPR-associated endonuclease Cas1 n=2 Tax=Methylotuvimicrobium TaxID=2822410 RepID=G4ST90_META2|nr:MULTISPECIES: type I-C CRISPR-associated endonuclease Cas1c [Methylotuvimicrobium]QCW82680.1 type I-C CRISPR-associated endonuclease Cas1 [Methylotuvimicrobium buryatense]CCE23843.1 CRISPR-associated protein Cas1 [Methylotuvimicrobium alcaliphilum 20Z]
MRPLRNVIYIQTQNSWLHKDNENLVLKVDKELKARVPIHKLQGLVCFGQVSISPYLMAHCAENGITITYLNQFGKFLARVEGPVSGNVLLRRTQHLTGADTAKSVAIARTMLTGKLYNQRSVLRRYLRDYGNQAEQQNMTHDLAAAEKRLSRCMQQLADCNGIDTLMGREGEAAQVYFGVFQHLIRQPGFEFDARRRRPPTDPVNALLSFCYTLLTHDCRSALETVGLDPASGFLHQLRSGRPSLALDLVEEFRPMVERFVLSLINKRQLALNDFETWPNGSVTLKEEPRKTLLAAWQDRKQDTLMHPWFEETVPVGLLPWLQAQILARFLRGDCDSYVPFLWK